MCSGYRIGDPARPSAPARPWHEGSDGDDFGCRVAVASIEVDGVAEPRVIDYETAVRGIAGDQDEVLVVVEIDLSHHRPLGVELRLDCSHVGTEPAGKGDAPTRVSGHGVQD